MFTAIAIALAFVAGWYASRGNDSDRRSYDALLNDEMRAHLQLHIRQDLKLLCWLLVVVIILLGVVADRI